MSQGLHWDTTEHESGKVEFTDLLFTPKRPGQHTSLPDLARSAPPQRSASSFVSETNPRRAKRTIRAIEDYSTGMWVHNGLTAREKATACLDMSNSYSNKTWMSKFRIAMSVNECTLKRKLKEGSPKFPTVRNEQGKLYRKQFRTKPKVRASNFAADWTNNIDMNEAKSRSESRAFRSRGSMMIREKSTSAF